MSRRPTHGSGARHEVVLKSLPFYDVLGEIMKPSSLGNDGQISHLTCGIYLLVAGTDAAESLPSNPQLRIKITLSTLGLGLGLG